MTGRPTGGRLQWIFRVAWVHSLGGALRSWPRGLARSLHVQPSRRLWARRRWVVLRSRPRRLARPLLTQPCRQRWFARWWLRYGPACAHRRRGCRREQTAGHGQDTLCTRPRTSFWFKAGGPKSLRRVRSVLAQGARATPSSPLRAFAVHPWTGSVRSGARRQLRPGRCAPRQWWPCRTSRWWRPSQAGDLC